MEDWNPISEVMSSRDILSIMAPKLSEATLRTLYDSTLRDDIVYVQESNDYWYEKSMYLVGHTLQERPGADWKTIYHILVKSAEYENIPTRYLRSLRYLDGLLVLEEIYGPIPLDSIPIRTILKETSSTDVLSYLITSGLKYDSDDLISAIRYHLSYDHKDMVKYLLDLKPKLRMGTSDLTNVLTTTIQADYLDILKIILGRYVSDFSELDEDDTKAMLTAAAESSPDILEYLLSNIEYSEEDLAQALTDSVIANNVESFLFLLSKVNTNTGMFRELVTLASKNGSTEVLNLLQKYIDIDWMDALIASIDGYSDEIVKYILTKIGQNEDLYPALIAFTRATKNGFAAILQDPRSNPIDNLEELILAIEQLPTSKQSGIMNILISDPRIRTEELSSDQVRKIFRSLSYNVHSPGTSPINSVITGYINAVRMFPLLDIPDLISGTDDYSLILRQIIFKRQSGSQLLDWMIEVGLENTIEASTSILYSDLPYSDEVAPIRALLICIMYPGMELIKQVEYLKEEGYEGEVLDKSMGLIGAYIGSIEKK